MRAKKPTLATPLTPRTQPAALPPRPGQPIKPTFGRYPEPVQPH